VVIHQRMLVGRPSSLVGVFHCPAPNAPRPANQSASGRTLPWVPVVDSRCPAPARDSLLLVSARCALPRGRAFGGPMLEPVRPSPTSSPGPLVYAAKWPPDDDDGSSGAAPGGGKRGGGICAGGSHGR
jgi:hypothetical protein